MGIFTYLNLELSRALTWDVAKAMINFKGELYSRAVEQATVKSRHTINSSQAGAYRSPQLKFQRQLMGCLAEIYVQEYLKEFLISKDLQDEWTAIRYDDVRTDEFRSPENEYDIRLIKKKKNTKILIVETRSSITRDRSLFDGLKSFDIIGPYASAVKAGEGYADIYIRPLYEYTDFEKNIYSDLAFSELMQNGLINLYIVGGCLKDDMKSKGYNKSMNQRGTSYRVLKITNGYDANKFLDKLVQLLNQ